MEHMWIVEFGAIIVALAGSWWTIKGMLDKVLDGQKALIEKVNDQSEDFGRVTEELKYNRENIHKTEERIATSLDRLDTALDKLNSSLLEISKSLSDMRLQSQKDHSFHTSLLERLLDRLDKK